MSDEKYERGKVKIKWKASSTRRDYWSEKYRFLPGDIREIPVEDALFLKKHFPDNIEILYKETRKQISRLSEELLSSSPEKMVEKLKKITDKHTLVRILYEVEEKTIQTAVKKYLRELIDEQIRRKLKSGTSRGASR